MDEIRKEKIKKKIEEQNKLAGIRISRTQIEKICEALEKKEEQGIPLKESLGFSEEMIQALYEFACRMGQAGEYQDAYCIYHLLMKVDSNEDIRYVLGKATASFMLEKYQEAMELFSICYMIDGKELKYLWYAIESSHSLPNNMFTMGLLKVFLKEAEGKPEYSADYERGKMIWETISRPLQEAMQLGENS